MESPARFIETAKGLSVEAATKQIAADPRSPTVRRLAVSVLSQFRQLNEDMVRLLAASCRDTGWVSESVLRRCQMLTSPITPNVARIANLLSSHDGIAVLAATSLLGAIVRSPRSTEIERSAASEALAQAVRSDNPFLDIEGDGAGRTLRRIIHAELSGVAWEGQALRAVKYAIGGAATGQSAGGFGDRGRRPAPLASTSVVDWVGSASVSTAIVAPQPLMVVNMVEPKEWRDVGLGGIPPEHQVALNRTIYEILEIRVGQELAGRMTSDQLDDFEPFIDAKDERGALQWLAGNFPDYREVAGAQYLRILEEVTCDADEIRERLSRFLVEGHPVVSLSARGVALVADGHADQAVPVLEEAVTLVEDLDDYKLTLTNALTALAAAHGDLDQPDDRDRCPRTTRCRGPGTNRPRRVVAFAGPGSRSGASAGSRVRCLRAGTGRTRRRGRSR